MHGRASILTGAPKLAAEGRTALSTVGWLAEMPEAFREAMLGEAIFRLAPARTEFMHAGDERGGIIAIARGTAEVAMPLGHPDTRAVHLAHAGFYASYKPLFGEARGLSLTARCDVLWALFPQVAVERLLHENPIWWRCIAIMIDQLNDVLRTAFVDLTRHDSTIRTVAVLLRLAGCRHSNPPRGTVLEVRLSQIDLAAMAVMSRNTLNTIIARLVEDGLIENHYRSIAIRDPVGLRAMVEADC